MEICREWKIRIFLVISLFSSFYIIGSSYLGLNGAHVWRQADAYSQILGFLHYKDMYPYSMFNGGRAVFDLPIYQYAIARTSSIINSDPLVTTRYINLALWMSLLASSGFISEKFQRGSTVFTWFLLSTSPLFLHYFSVPLPDTLCMAISAISVAWVLVGERNRLKTIAQIALLCIAALIKSPIVFVYLILLFSFVATHSEHKLGLKIKTIILFGLPCLISALAAEFLRTALIGEYKVGFAQDPNWYFGDFLLRGTGFFWSTLWERLQGAFCNKVFFYFSLISVLFVLIQKRLNGIRTAAPFLLSFLSGWLVFSGLYVIHDYYELAVTHVFMMFSGVSICYLTSRIIPLVIRETANPRKKRAVKVLTLIATISIPIFVLQMNKLSSFESDDIYAGARYALKNEKKFLYVSDGRTGPSVGGLLKTPFNQVSFSELEQNCENIIKENNSIVVAGYSECLRKNKWVASTFIEGSGMQIFVSERSKTETPVATVINTQRKIKINGFDLVLRNNDSYFLSLVNEGKEVRRMLLERNPTYNKEWVTHPIRLDVPCDVTSISVQPVELSQNLFVKDILIYPAN